MTVTRVQNFIDDNKGVNIDNDLLKDGAITKLNIDFDADGVADADATDYLAQVGKEVTTLDKPGAAAGEKYKVTDFGKYYQTDWQEGWSIGDKGKMVRLGWIFDKANTPILREAAMLEGRYVAPEELSELSQAQLTSFCRDNILPDFKAELATLGNKLPDFKRGDIGEAEVGKFKDALTANKAYALKDALNQLYDLDAYFASEDTTTGIALQETFDLAVLHFDYLNEGLELIEDTSVTALLQEAMKVDAWSKPIMNDAGDAIDADKITVDTVAQIMDQPNMSNVVLALVNQAHETQTVYPLEDWSNADSVAEYIQELIVLLANVGIDIPNVTNDTNITGVGHRNGRVLTDQSGKPIKIDVNGAADGGVEKARLKPNTDGLRAIEAYLLQLLEDAGYAIDGRTAAATMPASTGSAPVMAMSTVAVETDTDKNTWLVVDLTGKELTDKDGAALTIIHAKVIKDPDTGEVTSVDLYAADRTTGIKLEGDDAVDAHTFESTQAFVDWAGGNSKEVETEVITQTINSLFSNLQVTFKSAKSELKDKAGIDRLATFIIAHKEDLNPIDMLVTGYASVDSSSLNQGLANGRAVAIVEYLSQVLRDADVGPELVALTAFNHGAKATTNTVGGGTYYIEEFKTSPGALIIATPREVVTADPTVADPTIGTAPAPTAGIPADASEDAANPVKKSFKAGTTDMLAAIADLDPALVQQVGLYWNDSSLTTVSGVNMNQVESNGSGGTKLTGLQALADKYKAAGSLSADNAKFVIEVELLLGAKVYYAFTCTNP
jgi:hypothetical protein